MQPSPSALDDVAVDEAVEEVTPLELAWGPVQIRMITDYVRVINSDL